MKINHQLLLAFAILILVSCTEEKKAAQKIDFSSVREGFIIPPDSVKPWCYWYWINDDISKEGVTRDLEAMKEVGIGAALIGNINPDEKDGRVPMLSEEWWGIMVHAVNEGKRLGVDIGAFNCPGWSQSGGPWVRSDMAMRYVTYTETKIDGGQKIETNLMKPTEEFQDTYVLAFPSIQAEEKTLSSENSTILVSPSIKNNIHLIDRNTTTLAGFSKSVENYQVDIKTKEFITARSLKIVPSQDAFKVACEVLAETNGSYNVIKSFTIDRSKLTPNVGPDKFAPILVELPETESQKYRLKFQALGGTFQSNTYPNVKISAWHIAEIIISEAAGLEDYAEKSLGKMHPTPFPSWDSYLWKQQKEINTNELTIDRDKIIDISDKMDSQGNISWEAPAGEWTIQRFGMTPTGTKNSPAAPQGKGYEIDKMNEELIRFHFDQFIGEFLKRIPEESKSAFKYVIGDSYEMGSQNWTDGFSEKFQAEYGYDPVPFLPVFTGKIVKSVEHSERFLWDLRRMVADKVAYEYVGGLRKISNENGLKLWLENYGHWGFPSEFLMYGGQSDLVAGEFWNEGTLGDIECKASSSSAHIYGKPRVSAEAFTAANSSYLRHPAKLKRRGDWSFTEGINHFVLHLYIQQPDETRKPGVNAWFSTEFNRHNTWFEQSKEWMTYLRRNQHMLTKGQYAADVAYFIGENTPIMTGTQNPALPQGYSYDYINAEVLMNRVTVKDGRITFPDGMSYGLMVLPPLSTMRPEVLEKIQSLVKAGAAIYGGKPTSSPSLENYPEGDARVRAIAEEMWGQATENEFFKAYGNGFIANNMSLQAALDKVGIQKDLKIDEEINILWTHRTAPNGDIYFITNQSGKKLEIAPSFKVIGKQAQLWNAVTGEIRMLPESTESGAYTTIPLQLEVDESYFIVFSETVLTQKYATNFPDFKSIIELNEDWAVDFSNKDIGPKKTVFMNELTDWNQYASDSIKYYSGKAIYTTTFTADKVDKASTYKIDLGDVSVMAFVKLNGKELGTTWISPYQLDITNAIQSGENTLEVKVANLWRNRLIKDKGLPEAERYSWVMVEDIKPNEKPPSAGLLGPVTILSIDQ